MAFALRVRELPKAEIDQRVRDVAGDRLRSGSCSSASRGPSPVDSGNVWRWGGPSSASPAVFLMDEPLSNLDAKLRLHTRGELKRFQRQLATTTIYVTHDQAEAMTLADRVAIMNRGVLQQLGPPKEVYARPASVFVAGFLGSPPMNLLDAQTASDAGVPALQLAGATMPMTGSLAARLGRHAGADGAVILGVRPEDVQLHHEQRPGAVHGEVFVVEDLGNERLVTLDLGGQFMMARTASDYPAEMGDRLWFGFDQERAHLFDPVTQRRID